MESVHRQTGRCLGMDVSITVVTGGGKKTTRRSKSIVLKEVQIMEQVTDALGQEFKEFFPNQQKLTADKGVKK